MQNPWMVTLAIVAGVACGGTDRMELSDDSTLRILVTRSGSHPNYSCEGTIVLRGGRSRFGCNAEGYADWAVNGTAEQFRLVDSVRFWVRDSGTAHAGQPEIAIDLEYVEGRLFGWATVVLPDGTGFGHTGAEAEGWLQGT